MYTMTDNGGEPISEQEKLRIAKNFIIHSPPGELSEIYNDIKILLKSENFLEDDLLMALAQYNKEHLTPVKTEGSNHQTLITVHNDLGAGRYFDDSFQVSFKFDHIKRQASDFESWSPDPTVEKWRSAIDYELTRYTKNHYRNGICSVFSKTHQKGNLVVMCIEDHQFQHNNYWNGSWCSQWSVILPQGLASAEVQGILKIQIHYYEEGNVQLESSKEIKESIACASALDLVKEIIQLVKSAESDYQSAVSADYQMMADNDFKALRRQLPITHAKIDWNKIVSYSIGKMFSGY